MLFTLTGTVCWGGEGSRVGWEQGEMTEEGGRAPRGDLGSFNQQVFIG